MIDITLPTRPSWKKYSLAVFNIPVFTNMLPEGANRRALCRAKKVDENDFFGMLEMICGMDAIGKFVLRRPEE